MKSDICWEVIPTPRPDRVDILPIKSFKETQTDTVVKNQCPSVEPTRALTKSDLLFIKDLEPNEKSKIALMIQQIVKLEQSCSELSREYDIVKDKLEKKSELCNEVQECIERMSVENDQLKKELISKDEILYQNSIEMEKTNELLKLTSSMNKKLQKRLNKRKRDVEVQTEPDNCSISLQTSLLYDPSQTQHHNPNTPPQKQQSESHQDSMNVFLSKLDNLCDKLSAIDRDPPVVKEPANVMVHNHKTGGHLVSAEENRDVIYQVDEEEEERGGGGVIRPGQITDSIVLVKEGSKAGRSSCEGSKYNSKLFSIIDELEGVEPDNEEIDDEETLLCDLFYKI